MLYSSYFGGGSEDVGYGITVDTNNDAYVTGLTDSADLPTTGSAFQPTYGGNGDAFFAEINTAGSGPSSLIYSTFLGGTGLDQGNAITIDATGEDVLLVGRAEGFLVGQPDIDQAVARLVAYAHAGADCLYAPGIQSAEHIRRVVEAVHPKPVNVLVMAPATQSLRQLAELGVRRVSVGGALARAAWGGFMHAAREIAEHGRFDALANAASGRTLNALFDEPGG